MTLPSPFFQQDPVSTIPSQNKQQQNKLQQKITHEQPQQPPAKVNFTSFCKYCQEGFSNDTELFQHRRSHAKCPYDECKFNANEATIAVHIQRVHLKQTSLVKIQDLTTPEQIEKWREERRKRYPTTQNVILRQQIQEDRLKRGERLNDSKKRFGDHQQRDFVKNMGNKQHDNKNRGQKQNRNRERNNRFQKHPGNKFNGTEKQENQANGTKNPDTAEINQVESKNKDPVEVKHFKNIKPQQFKPPFIPKPVQTVETSSDEEEPQTMPKFQGTSKMKDFHSVEAIVKDRPALSVLGMYGSDSEDTNSDEELANVNGSAEKSSNLTENQNLQENVTTTPQNDEIMDENEDEQPENEELIDENLPDGQNNEENVSDEGPDEIPTVKKIENEELPKNSPQRSRKRKRNGEKQVPKKVVRRSGLDYSKVKNRSVNPFLEKLLERDIVHERNVLLQCVNFVVKNNFFGIGQATSSTEKSVEESNQN